MIPFAFSNYSSYIFRSTALLLLFSLLISMQACKPTEKTEKQKLIEATQDQVNKLEALLIIDEKVIEKRLDSMQEKIKWFEAHPIDSAAAEAASAYILYKGIASNYENFLVNYPLLEFELARQKQQLTQLKNKAEENEDKVEEELKQLKNEADRLLEASGEAVKRIHSVENDYHRTRKLLQPLYRPEAAGQKQ